MYKNWEDLTPKEKKEIKIEFPDGKYEGRKFRKGLMGWYRKLELEVNK